MRSYFFSSLFFFFFGNMLNNGASKGVTGGIDMKFTIEALTSKVKRMFRDKLE